MKYDAFLYDFDNRPFLKEEVIFYRGFIKKNGIKTYLEYGVGTGRIFSVLVPKLDYAVGVDMSVEMLNVCRKKVKNLNNYKLFQGDFLEFNSNEVFDLLAIPFNSFHHILSKNDQIKFLSKVRESMGENSFFILDTVNYKVVKPLRGQLNEWRTDYSCTKKKISVVRTQKLIRRNFSEKTLEKIFKYEVFCEGVKINEENFDAKMKFSTYSDIKTLLDETGLKIVKVFCDYKFNEGTDGRKAIYLIKKKV